MDDVLKAANGGAQPFALSGKDEVVRLSRNQTLIITRATTESVPPTGQPGEECVRLIDAQGATSLTIRLRPEGPVIEIGGASMALKVEGDLAIAARRLLLHGSEGISLSSDASVKVAAGENLALEAKRQDITATLGDVKVYANDDVKLEGERIRMNC